MNRMSYAAGKVNVSNMAKTILGLPTATKVSEMTATKRKEFYAVCGVFRGRGYSADRWTMGNYKTGKGMKLIEKFVMNPSFVIK